MLLEPEWKIIAPRLHDLYHVRHRKCPPQGDIDAVLALYRDLTGYVETKFSDIWHHRVIHYGRLCPWCGKPLRTPKAKLCAECGHFVNDMLYMTRGYQWEDWRGIGMRTGWLGQIAGIVSGLSRRVMRKIFRIGKK
jgi:hypothetical protein